MTLALLTMSQQELDRANWMGRIRGRRATQAQVAERIGLSLRQVERLYRAYKAGGAAALAREKLSELHGLHMSVETLRQWMIADGLWLPRAARRVRPHPPRYRWPCHGELVQIDGCDHEWFEERAPRCTLLVFIDDATGRLMQLHFGEVESTFEYFEATRGYIAAHQDRLVKELRLRNVSSLEAANAFAPEFMAAIGFHRTQTGSCAVTPTRHFHLGDNPTLLLRVDKLAIFHQG